MNKVILMGRLTRDPDVRYIQGETEMAVAKYTLAVGRYRKGGKEQQADFIPCVVFRKGAEFAEKYFHQGMKLLVSGHIQTGSYVNKDGHKVYTTEVMVTEQEFAEKKAFSPDHIQMGTEENGFMNIPEGIDDEELPFQ
ncbi:MAG: single-stranded DNA-binding protein [Lachnospiraceae bacterium]|nr:single-stranded DNA-binding protein [Lachnospiraceae bacterium]